MNESRLPLNRRNFLQLSLAAGEALVAPAVLASCSGGGASPGKATSLVVAALTTPANIDQDLDTSAPSHEIRMNTMERLMAYALEPSPVSGVMQENFKKIEPRLAKSWTVNPQHTEITFHLREGVKSPWGNAFTAADVDWTWKRAWALKTVGSFYLRSVLKMRQPSWRVLDKHTIRLTIPEPNPLLESVWINMDLGVFDSTVAKSHTTAGDPWARQWISQTSPSFAPYKVTTWKPGSQVELTAWSGYYRGQPAIERVVFQQVPESSNRLALVRSGGAQIGEDLAPRDFVQGSTMKGIKPVSLVGNSVYRIEFDNKTHPFDSTLVRQALNYAVDRKALIEGPWAKLAEECKSPLPPTYPGYAGQYFQFTHDPSKAKELLARAGFPHGFETSLSYRAESDVENEMARLIQTNLAEVGVRVSLSKQPGSTYLQNILTHKYPMYLYVDSSILPNPPYALNLWLNSNSAINYSRYHNENVDQLIEKLLSTLDETTQVKLAGQVQKAVMEDPPWIYLVYPGYHVLLSDRVSGFAWRTPVNPIEYRNLKLS